MNLSRRSVLIGTGAAAWIGPAAAQGTRVPTVGIVRINAQSVEQFFEPFRRDMAALGWDDGRNVRFEIRWSDGRNERVAANLAELVARPVDVLVVFGNFETDAAQRATRRIPIVAMNDDIVGGGLVASWTHPGGNTTGVSIMATELDVKRLELLHELVPGVGRIGVLEDPNITTAGREVDLANAAKRFGIELVTVRVKSADEVARGLDAVASAGIGAVNVLASPMLNAVRATIIARLRQARLPAIYEWPETAEEGGLMGYGPRLTRVYRQVAVMIDKVLRGAKPSELAIEQPTRFDLVLNLKTAKAIGLAVPPALLGRADEVIE